MTPMTVPDDFVVVRGGTKPLPLPGTPFSAAAGPDLADAAKGIPHGQLRRTSAGRIRALGGTVEAKPELTKSGIMNDRHVEVVEGRVGSFGEIEPNPVPKEERIR
jgi:hypothetical protein